MESVPLALFANGVAAALNELRHCAPLALQQPVTQVVQVCVVLIPSDALQCYQLCIN
jgi:hypothetical protein